VVSNYDDHLPLYRQTEIFACDGVNLETSTLCGWVGATVAALKPLVDARAADVLAGDTLHLDDTPVPVGAGNWQDQDRPTVDPAFREGRLCARRAAACRPRGRFVLLLVRPPGRTPANSPEGVPRRHPRRRRRLSSGRPSAGPGAGFNELFAGGRIVEAGCWAHVRRKFFDLHAATGSPITKEALDRIGQFDTVEQTINGAPPDRRRQQRQVQLKPIVQAVAAWADTTLRQLSRKSELAQAFRDRQACWTALVRWADR
jgi:transposase